MEVAIVLKFGAVCLRKESFYFVLEYGSIIEYFSGARDYLKWIKPSSSS